MASSSPSSHTISGEAQESSLRNQSLDLRGIPPIYVLATHMNADALHDAEDTLTKHGATLTYDLTEARLVLTMATTKKRVEYDLRTRRLWTTEVPRPELPSKRKVQAEVELADRPKKRTRRTSLSAIRSSGHSADISGDTTESDMGPESESGSPKPILASFKPVNVNPDPIIIHGSDSEFEVDTKARLSHTVKLKSTPPRVDSVVEPPLKSPETVRVLKLAWLEDSLKAGKALPAKPYLLYEGLPIARPPPATSPRSAPSDMPRTPTTASPLPKRSVSPASIMERARADIGASSSARGPSHFAPAPHGPRRFDAQQGSRNDGAQQSHKEQVQLLQQTTSEYEGTDSDIPPAPEWVRKGWKYACQRSTPPNPPNEAFINELEKIKMARILTGDEIGVRAYNTSIASCRAYPYVFGSVREILQLPGCDVKIANLWVEWKNTGRVKAAEEAENDESLKILRSFWEIWGVGERTAREFYYDKGWKDLDDVVEYGWNDLTRVQQIGVKFYDDFQQPIPRDEVERIATIIKEHAVKVRDEGIELVVVGGYRRGKEKNNDVDVIVSHRDPEKTRHLARDITTSLEEEEWITHTLLLSETTTDRGQSTLPYKVKAPGTHGTGFDSLDKSLLVWQDPHWPTKEQDLQQDPNARNPNIHRRVDVIVSPWRTVGCAVLGWSGGNTFQRDLRRYAKNVKGWKFDSTGIRDRSTGEVIALEGPEGVSGSMIDAEKKVFEGFGLVYREPRERWTG